ncbi:hypothetical protein FB45DRAFT_774680, partial [Roridomyces roridus]
LPKIMPSFGKLQIVDGDSIRSASAAGDGSSPQRDKSFVRVITDPWNTKLFYGQLQRILVCQLPENDRLKGLSGARRLMALITPCKHTNGRDAALEITTYRGMSPDTVVDLQNIVAVVGRVKTRGSWKIIDRTDGLVHPEFIQELWPEEDGGQED